MRKLRVKTIEKVKVRAQLSERGFVGVGSKKSSRKWKTKGETDFYKKNATHDRWKLHVGI